MLKYSKCVYLLRFCSMMLLFSVPHRYLALVLPIWALPVWGIVAAGFVHALHKKNIQGEAAFLLGLAAALILPALVLGILVLIPQLQADILYLRLSLIAVLLGFTAFLSAASTALFLYIRQWRRYEPLAAIVLFSILFLPQQHYRLTVFSNPLFAALFAGVFLLIQIALLCGPFIRQRRFLLFLLFFIPLSAALLLVLTQVFNKSSVGNNGGLLEQKLFDFDFSQFLQLQDEVTMNSHLVMIVHVDHDYAAHLFRRMYLAGWDPKKGFFEKAAPDEIPQLLTVPKQPLEIPHQTFQSRERVVQEIFTVNLDPSSFIALDYPLSVSPYTVWDTVSFKGAYKTESEIVHSVPLDLITSDPPSGDPVEGLSQKDLDFYTAVDEETKRLLLPLAESVTGEFALYSDKIYALLEYFREGEYRYSLHPGHAPDGNQLKYFVTESKKGYCSYFAFSYCLMLRSLGIPARVAAGFFLQPDAGVLNYYPVRANMAHAWVEVFFPHIGWVDFDPTTEQLAADEALDFSFQAGGDQFTALLDEILLNRSALRLRQDGLQASSEDLSFPQRMRRFFQMHKNRFIIAAAAALCLIAAGFFFYPYLIVTYSRNNRKVILMLKKLHKRPSAEFSALTQKAKFAPQCTDEDRETARRLYRCEKRQRMAGKNSLLILLLLLTLPLKGFPESGEETLLHDADRALQAENWDAAAALLEEGIKRYPENELFPLKLGDMYFENGLYEPAYRRFTQGLRINKYNIKLLYGAANAAAALNKADEARNFLHEYLSYNPADIFAWSSYGWLCFKTHRTEEGIQAMLDACRNYGDDGSLANALGNLYGELFDYRNAHDYYRKGIELALQHDSYYSAAIYSYNKAILEAAFYRFTAAEEDARNSVEYFSRASGYLMLGELEERRNNFSGAIAYYIQATKNNRTPLPLLRLAHIYVRMGHVEQAERYMAQIERVTDYSWIAHFGMSLSHFYADLYDIYTALYEKKYAAEKMRIAESITDSFVRRKNLVQYAVMLRYYRACSSVYNIRLAKEYALSGNGTNSYELYKNSFYYQAFKKTPFKAQRYLSRAEQLETALIPQAQASYTAERGILLRNEKLLDQALQTLDPVWEKELWEQTAAALIECTRNAGVQAALYSKLMRSNPACFLDRQIHVPVRLLCSGADIRIQRQTEKHTKRALKKSLFTLSDGAPFTLTAVCSAESVILTLIDTGGTVYFRYTHPAPALTKNAAAVCINRFAVQLFRVRE